MEIVKSELDNGRIIKVDIGSEQVDNEKRTIGAIELDIENQSIFVDVINSIFDTESSRVIVNMSNISYIDSSGLWALFEGHKKASQRNGQMVLLSPTKDVRRVLDITKMSAKMKIFDVENEAVESLQN